MKPYSIYLGIDPGVTGAIASISTLAKEMVIVSSIPMLDKEIDVQKLIGITPFPGINIDVVACIEEVWQPNRLVRDAGILEGMLLTFDIPVYRITCRAWRTIILGSPDATKKDAIDYCTKNYNMVNLYRTEKSKSPDHNYAEALCIAEYCQRKHSV